MLMSGVTLAGVTCEGVMLVVETSWTTAGQQTGVDFCQVSVLGASLLCRKGWAVTHVLGGQAGCVA